MSITEDELAKLLAENPDLKVKQENPSTPLRVNPLPRLVRALEQKPHKYHAQRTEYNGRWYASKKEALHAQENDLKIKAGYLDFYLTQVPFRLPGGITYRADFAEFTRVVNTPIFEVHWVDTKGYDTPVSDLKRKQVKEIYGIEIEVI